MGARGNAAAMAHFLFVDESGYDSGASPYGVLGGAAVEDREIWSVVQDIRASELKHFGTPYSAGERETESEEVVESEGLPTCSSVGPLAPEERMSLAHECLEKGAEAGLRQITALAQSEDRVRCRTDGYLQPIQM